MVVSLASAVISLPFLFHIPQFASPSLVLEANPKHHIACNYFKNLLTLKGRL